MVKSEEIIEKLQNGLSIDDRKIIDGIFSDIQKIPGRKSRKTIVSDINNLIIDAALKNNKPSLLVALPDIQGNEIEGLFSKILQQYIKTGDESWLNTIHSLSEKLGKKSHQSRIFAMISRDLIDAGVSASNQNFIDQGVRMLDQISFRKYRSEIMIDIIPLLIVWAISIRDERLLHDSLRNIEEICDISKRAVLHTELAKAMATIAILKKNSGLFSESIRCAVAIRQKLRRQECIFTIIEKGAKSAFGKEISDIPQFTRAFADIPSEELLEIISALTEQLIDQVKDKTKIITVLKDLCQQDPITITPIIINLLKKAEQSGDPWYLYSAIELEPVLIDKDSYPYREMVKAAVSIAHSSKNMKILNDVIHVIDNSPNKKFLSRTYLQFSQIMLSYGNFNLALCIFSKINNKSDNFTSYSDGLTNLLKTGIIEDKIFQVNETILKSINGDIVPNAINRSVIEVGKDQPYDAIVSHIQSLKQLIHLHPDKDHLSLEFITHIIDRGFLDTHDPGALIKIADSITDKNLKEKAISGIVIKIARIGVQTRNRDFLQRAVGLTCEIEGQDTRSVTFSSIIDEASILAAQQGDLDLLLRMKDWSGSLLEKKSASYAMTKVVEGILKYAIDRRSPEALEQAYLIAKEIDDPALKNQLFEKIAEHFVRVGCILLKNSSSTSQKNEYDDVLYPFERGLEIIKENVKNTQLSLKIAGIIDIILSYSRTSSNPDFIIMLTLYSVEIENSYEKDAMMYRIVSNLNTTITHPDSTDPYEIITFLLQKNDQSKINPKIIELKSQVVQRINNSYVKLSGLCNLADLLIRLGNFSRAREILDETCNLLSTIHGEYEKILILADLTTLFCQLDKEVAKKCLETGIKKLDAVERDKNSIARKQLVYAIVNLNTLDPKDEWVTVATQIALEIDNPVEFIHSLIAVHNMIRGDLTRSKEILARMIEATENIVSPYEKVTSLLDIIPLAVEDCTNDTPTIILKKAEKLAEKINIQYIADTIRDNVARVFSLLYLKQNKKEYLSHAIEIAQLINDDELRLNRLTQTGHPELFVIPPSVIRIKLISEKIIDGGSHSNQITQLEKLIRSIADRGKEAVFFCDLSILFKKEGVEKLSRRMMQNAIKEARIIRPLSRRAYVMCDIAMKMSAAGCERSAQEILDLSIDAATNIRQSSLRDGVFDELGLAIKIIQEM